MALANNYSQNSATAIMNVIKFLETPSFFNFFSFWTVALLCFTPQKGWQSCFGNSTTAA